MLADPNLGGNPQPPSEWVSDRVLMIGPGSEWKLLMVTGWYWKILNILLTELQITELWAKSVWHKNKNAITLHILCEYIFKPEHQFNGGWIGVQVGKFIHKEKNHQHFPFCLSICKDFVCFFNSSIPYIFQLFSFLSYHWRNCDSTTGLIHNIWSVYFIWIIDLYIKQN